MRFVSFQSEAGIRVAAVRDGAYVDLAKTDSSLPHCMKRFLALGAEGLERAADAVEKGPSIDPQSVKLLPPVPMPQKIICIGLNYADHAKESGATLPEEPVVFNKFPTAIRAHGEEIQLPTCSDGDYDKTVDYEAELVVVIGRRGRFIPKEDALSYVAGYCCGHDVSARDWQLTKPERQWLLGKSFDTFAPCGPELVTADEVVNPGNLRIQMRLNGQTMQDSTTAQLIFPIDELVAYISGVCTLEPGDMIFTGTPPGVGAARDPKVFLKSGDIAEIEIEKLGTLRNPVVAQGGR